MHPQLCPLRPSFIDLSALLYPQQIFIPQSPPIPPAFKSSYVGFVSHLSSDESKLYLFGSLASRDLLSEPPRLKRTNQRWLLLFLFLFPLRLNAAQYHASLPSSVACKYISTLHCLNTD